MTPSPAIARSATRRIAWRLLPFLWLLYLIAYLDRANVAFANLEMSRDLQFSDSVFGLGAGIFFISYLALQIPGALMVERFGARRVISACMISWGSLTILTSLVHTPVQLYVARFVLGAAEAGFFPGVIVYFSYWFIREDRAKATSNFMRFEEGFDLGTQLRIPAAFLIQESDTLRRSDLRGRFKNCLNLLPAFRTHFGIVLLV